jgi:hypothetical protein
MSQVKCERDIERAIADHLKAEGWRVQDGRAEAAWRPSVDLNIEALARTLAEREVA